MSKVAEKYTVITPQSDGNLESVVHKCVGYHVLACILWLVFSALAGFRVEWQAGIVMAIIFYHFASKEGPFVRSEIDLRAKGVDIKDPNLTAIMPWDWLTKVEIRQRSISIFPNYV